MSISSSFLMQNNIKTQIILMIWKKQDILISKPCLRVDFFKPNDNFLCILDLFENLFTLIYKFSILHRKNRLIHHFIKAYRLRRYIRCKTHWIVKSIFVSDHLSGQTQFFVHSVLEVLKINTSPDHENCFFGIRRSIATVDEFVKGFFRGDFRKILWLGLWQSYIIQIGHWNHNRDQFFYRRGSHGNSSLLDLS